MKKLYLLPLGLLLTACVSGYNPTYYYNEVQVVNLTGDTISDVSVRVVDSRALACDEVLKFAMCDERFGKRRYPQLGIELAWTGADGERRSDSFSPPVPVYFSASFPLRIVMEVNEDGTVKPFYEQEEPGRGDYVTSGLMIRY